MQEQVLLTRTGACNNCGVCCQLIRRGDGTLGPCGFFDPTQPKHCQAYDQRPAVCQAFPAGPWDTVAIPQCGFQFVDVDSGRVVDGYMIQSTAPRLRQAQKLLRSHRP